MSYERLAKHNFFAKVSFYNTISELFILKPKLNKKEKLIL